MSHDELLRLLTRARQFNHSRSITGMLLYCDGSFFQVLEGEEPEIDALYRMIRKDPRHGKITQIIKEPIAHRSFSEWSMAFAGATPDQLDKIEGLKDFFTSGSCLADIDTGRAKKLLNAFSCGRWRNKLQ